MKQMKRYVEALRDELIKRNLYQEKNERLIQCAARCQWFIDMMEEELRKTSLTITQIGSQSQTKVSQHPHVESIRKFNQTLAYCLSHLGMGQQTTDNGQQTTETWMEKFLNEIE